MPDTGFRQAGHEWSSLTVDSSLDSVVRTMKGPQQLPGCLLQFIREICKGVHSAKIKPPNLTHAHAHTQTHGLFMGVASITWAILENLSMKIFEVTNQRKFTLENFLLYGTS